MSLLRRLRRQQRRPHKLGSWSTATGNHVSATFRRDRLGVLHVDFEGNVLPLRPDDVEDYELRIRPEVIQRVREYTERVGRTLVIAV